MTISCRTGCGQDVLYEMESFPDGFIYHMPLNLDETIHNCSNLPENKLDDEPYENNTIWQEYRRLEVEIDVRRHNDWELESSETKKIENYKKELVLQQIKCTLFPSPRMYGYVTSDIVDLPDGEKEYWWTDLTELSMCYEEADMLDCAITALILQDKMTHNQSKKILELENKKNQQLNTTNSEYEFPIDTKLTVMQIRDTHVRRLEKKIKDFLRKHYSIKKFSDENNELFLKIDESREIKNKGRDVTIGKFDDHYEHLTFGACLEIINKEVKRCKQNNEPSIFLKIDSSKKREMAWVKDNFRNENDHTVENVEKEFTIYDKALAISYSEKVIKHLNDLENI